MSRRRRRTRWWGSMTSCGTAKVRFLEFLEATTRARQVFPYFLRITPRSGPTGGQNGLARPFRTIAASPFTTGQAGTR